MNQEKCAYCGDMVDIPFECNYCKDPFCAEHRLPEDHRCVKLTQIRAKKFGQRGVIRDGGIILSLKNYLENSNKF
jgi:predicted nucleic acid binding AN1-type Zn finger protein